MKNYLLEEYQKMISKIDSSSIHVRNEENKKLTFQFFSKGENYNGKLMVVGRAVNGWDKEFEWIHGKNAEELPEKMVERAYKKSLIAPLQWVINFWGKNEENTYNTAKSPFWQLTKETLRLIEKEQFDEQNWATKIIWSNLYKVAPAIGGNPNSTLCKLQLDYCRNILRHEIVTNKPAVILFVTGQGWFDDFGLTEIQTDDYKPIIVISERPEFKSPAEMALKIYEVSVQSTQ